MNFSDSTKRLTSRFLQTVVVFDDEAYFKVPKEQTVTEPLVEPSPRGTPPDLSQLKKSTAKATDQDKQPSLEDASAEITLADEVRPASKSHQLDAKVLIDSFAANGQVCAVIAPAKGEDLIQSVVISAENSDVVVLDWQIGGDNGQTAIQVINRIIECDKKNGGRLRLIVVYTGEPQLQSCFDRVKQDVNNLAEQSTDRFVLGNQTMRIVFIKKTDGTKVETVAVSQKDLPARIVAEFAEFVGGLLPNAVMAAVAAIRERIHVLLRRFSKELDGAYLGHRMLLQKPEDAESFLFDLVGDEIKSLIDIPEICHKVVGLDSVSLYVKEFHGEQTTRAFKLRDDSSQDLIGSVEVAHIIEVLEKGPASIQEAWKWGGKSHFYARLYPLFHSSIDIGRRNYARFARLSSFRSEAYDNVFAEDFRPMLTLGSVLKDPQGQFLLCLQPVCDCVRLKSQRRFLFGEFDENSDSFDLVARDEKDDVRLCFAVSPSRLSTIAFDPGSNTEVHGTKINTGYTFTLGDGKKYSWIGELRRLVAQRFASRFSEEIQRIGLAEFEWQRLYSRKN
jgi:hypothetical protein